MAIWNSYYVAISKDSLTYESRSTNGEAVHDGLNKVASSIICKEIPTSTVATFPPLQHLHLSNPAGPDWIKMINCCSGSLRTLRIDLNSDSCGQSDQKKLEIKLPMLRRFTYTINWVFGYQPDSGQPRQPPVVFRTPVLEIYEEERTYPYAYRGHPVHPSTLLHDDVSNVRAIHIGGISIPACVLRSEKLEILSVSAAHILDTGARLFREQDACPNLRVLRISEDTGPSIPKATYEKVEMLINLRNQRSSKSPEDYLVFDLEKRYETNHPESKPHVQGDIDMAAKTAHSRAFTGY
ncbi:hypothetical protein FRC20_001737 [Serendipita sp. 405]|nr:hypothetical protein FRC20_001737 [Serendipita sp. 405]